LCRYFTAGHFDFDNEFWLNHIDTTSPSVKTLTHFKCNLCEKGLGIGRKNIIKSIPLCNGAGNSMCHFGSSKFWYNTYIEDEDTNENKDIELVNDKAQKFIEKLFHILEKFTQYHLESNL
jgi:hypothetical protein